MAEWTALLQTHRLLPLADALMPLVLPALGFELTPAEGTEASRAGGEPDLPQGFTWPSHAGRPLAFFLQLDLAELPADVGLPKTGTLSFFGVPAGPQKYSGPDAKNFQVLYFHPRFELQRTAPPPSLQLPASPAVAIRLVEQRSIPDYSSPWVHPHLAALAQVEANEDEPPELDPFERYQQLRDEVEGADTVGHRLGGYANSVQDDALVYAQQSRTLRWDATGAELEALIAEARNWRLLLQLFSDGRLGWNFLGGGVLYFCIAGADLAASRFGSVVPVIQR